MIAEDFIASFSRITRAGLPGEEAHSEAMPVNRAYTSEALKNAKNIRQSAVGVLFYPHQNSIHSILIQRPAYEGVHSNQLSFPGGKMDETDTDLEFTARRECFEEVALPFGIGTLIGELTEVYIPVSNFLVRPFVFFVDELPNLIPDEREVESIISFDVFQLTHDQTLKTKDMKLAQGFTRKNVPYFDINGHVVWGATAMMLAEVKAILRSF